MSDKYSELKCAMFVVGEQLDKSRKLKLSTTVKNSQRAELVLPSVLV